MLAQERTQLRKNITSVVLGKGEKTTRRLVACKGRAINGKTSIPCLTFLFTDVQAVQDFYYYLSSNPCRKSLACIARFFFFATPRYCASTIGAALAKSRNKGFPATSLWLTPPFLGKATAAEIANQSLLVGLIQLVLFSQGGRVSYLALLKPPQHQHSARLGVEWAQTLAILQTN